MVKNFSITERVDETGKRQVSCKEAKRDEVANY